MPPLKPELLKALRKGRFPLMDTAGGNLWRDLISALETDAAGTVAAIKAGMPDPDADFKKLYSPILFDVNTGMDDIRTFLGAAHERLCQDHSTASHPLWQDCIQRIRAVAAPLMAQSHVTLSLNADHHMGNGLAANPLTYLPDPAWGVTFGSEPDQGEIGRLAPAWNILKRRTYENNPLTAYKAKPHYVLAHLLNHNLNGAGDNPLNVVPFWAAANTQMAKEAESYVKELVLRGAQVSYTITMGPAVGMTPKRLVARAACVDDAQRALIDWEQYLPAYLVINCDVMDATGAWVNIVNNVHIDNYVPETTPLLRAS